MAKHFYLFIFILIFISSPAQWTQAVSHSQKMLKGERSETLYSLNLENLRKNVNRVLAEEKKTVFNISVPNLEGKLEHFVVTYAPVVSESLASKYDIRSYTGKSLDNPARTIRVSITPFGLSSTIFNGNKLEFIDKTEDGLYSIHSKTVSGKGAFACSTKEDAFSQAEISRLIKATDVKANFLSTRMSDRTFRTLRLAVSTTAEYTNYFGGVPQALAAINATLTRVNGIFERDLALQLILQDFPQLIYTDAKTDPYSDYTSGANGLWSVELQNTLTKTIGNGAYDIGHLFGANGGGGYAGRVGLVCVDDTPATDDLNKGAAFTSPADGKPSGDKFDIDFVAHEIGHQLGATHTLSYILELQNTGVEPGSGSTIMGYAGITNADVQANTDPYFQTLSINQIQAKMQSVSCDVEIPVNNQPPVIQALPSLTIPKSTAFVLTANAADAENDPLTYNWEQMDDAKSPVISITGNETTGPIFRSVPPSASPARYFPKFSRVLEGKLTNPTDWESVSHVARQLNFAVTVRDNSPLKLQQQTNSALQTITVGNDGPFKVITSQVYFNTDTPVNWDVANTSSQPYNVTDVKIDYSTDGGNTWMVLAASTPNDGTEKFSFQHIPAGSYIFIRVSALNNVFYAVGKATSVASQLCTGEAPENLTANFITKTSAQLSWTLVNGASYVVRYKTSVDNDWKQVNTNQNFIQLNGLTAGTLYDVQIAAVCSGITGNFGKSFQFATLTGLTYCTVSSDSAAEEYISSVSLANMTSNSGAGTFSDFSSDPAKIIKLTAGNSYQISVGFNTRNTSSNEAVKAWIDFNGNGLFDDSEVIIAPTLTVKSPVITTFKVPVSAISGKVVKMRVALRYNNLAITPCSSFDYGEIEDYAVVISGEQNFSSSEIILYPNPVIDYLNIDNVISESGYSIYDMSGRLIRSSNVFSNRIYVGDLAPAVYVLVFDSNGERISKKFVKN